MSRQSEAIQAALDYGRRVELDPDAFMALAQRILEFLNTPIPYAEEYIFNSIGAQSTTGVDPFRPVEAQYIDRNSARR